MAFTLSYDEKIKGWASFHSWSPGWILGINNMLFTIKEGQVYKHYDESVDRGNFYGSAYPSRVDIMVNDSPSEVKVAKALSIEGTNGWDTTVKAFESDQEEFSEANLQASDFQEKEGMWYSHIRRNEDTTDYSSKSVYGIGPVDAGGISGNDVTVTGLTSMVKEGDAVYSYVASVETLIGTVTSVNRDTDTITLSSVAGLSTGEYILGKKNARIEGAELRGYTFRVELETNSTSREELFALNTEVFKSYK